MKKIGIIVAMQKEWDTLFGQFKLAGNNIAEGTTEHGVPCVAIVSGIGKVNAAVAAYSLIKEHGVNEILSFGCAGGMDNDANVGDVVIGDSYCYHDVWCGKPNEYGQVQGHPMYYPSNWRKWAWLYPKCKLGVIATGDAFCENQMMAAAVVQVLGKNPIAVDMESAAIAQVCHGNDVPFTSIRVISDNPLLERHADEYEDFWKRKDETLAEIMRCFMKYKEVQ